MIEINLTDTKMSSREIDDLPTDIGLYGALWSDESGGLYASSNNPGQLFHIRDYTSDNPVAEFLTESDNASNNDGMSDVTQKSPFIIPLVDLDGTDTPDNQNYSTTFTEDEAAVNIVDTTADDGLIIRDYINNATTADGDRLKQATITLTNPFEGDEFTNFDSLPATISYAVTGDVGSGEITVTLTPTTGNTASVTDFENALKAIQFQNTSQAPDNTDRIIEIVLEDENGNFSYEIFGPASTERHTTTIQVIPVNDAPSFEALNNTPTVSLGGNAVVLDDDATIIDPELGDRNNYNGATLELARNGGANSEDVFSSGNTTVLGALTEGGTLTVDGTVIGTVTTNSGGTLLLTFNNDAATGDLVNLTLQNIAYSNTGTTAGSVTIDYTINDGNTADDDQGTGGALSDTGSITVTLEENNPPTATNDTAATAPGTPVTFNITDNDSDSDGTLDLSSVDLDPSTATRDTSVTVDGEGTYEVDDAGNVTFTPADGFTGTATPISYTVSDNDGAISNAANITVTVENTAPTATNDTAATAP
ncbi:Ig-like domain-containing protein, partial [Lyngbya sp. CCY1209]|uniref:Ig-like domain-containing protein n=1 Tax=Lyngbya sp. CCY1209 TaxID=2886103 RepID=UPI002D208A84